MGNLSSVWSNLDNRRRALVVGATVAVFAAVLGLTRLSTTPDMALLYAGLDDSAAGEVIGALEQQGVPYDVRLGSIFVPRPDRDRLRMTLASAGLPANSAQGYELLDNLSGFGTTSQMFDAAYWRAKEGELARTMLASPHIRSARVHISAATAQPFRREQTPTAAVTVSTLSNSLDKDQADALRFLVASAVPGLAPSDVAVIDGAGGLILGDQDAATTADSLERSDAIRMRVERLLAARVGPGNAVVEVSLETINETETIVERLFDPETRIAISTDVQESTASSEDSRNGDVTVASNLPEGDGQGGSGAATNQNSETRAVTNYEVSETQREVLRMPGAVKRVSVAILVNGIENQGADGATVFEPRSKEELADLEVLVASAVGFDAERGDQITIRSMPFEELPVLGSEATQDAPAATPLDMMRLIQTAVLAVVALILGLFVVRPVLSGRATQPALLDDSGAGVGAMAIGNGPANVIDGVVAPDTPVPEAEQLPPPDPVDRLRDLIDGRRDEAVQVLQSWIDDRGAVDTAK